MPDEVVARKRLIDYLPPFMQDFAEIKAIMRTEQPELDRAWLDIQIPLADAFIMDCNEYGIKKYEALVGVIPGPEDTLDERKARVLIWWNNFIPYTVRVLARRLNDLCGVGNYEISGSLQNYELLIKTSLMCDWQIQGLEHLIIQMVPMNMNCGTGNEITCEARGTFGWSGGICYVEDIIITSDFEEDWFLEGNFMSRGGTVFAGEISLTSDFEEEHMAKGSAMARGLTDNTAFLQISSDIKGSAVIAGIQKAAALTAYATANRTEPESGMVFVEFSET